MSRTVASHPARIPVDLGHFLRCDRKDLWILVGSLAAGGALLLVSWKPAVIVMGLGAFVVVFSVLQARDLFLKGDLCPAVVLDPDRQLVAVLTDLSQGGPTAPALKVLAQPLRRAVKGSLQKGTRLAFVALYSGRPGARVWTNFGGYLADLGTPHQKTVQRAVSRIDEAEWERLLAAVRELESPYRPGLYDLRRERDGVERKGFSVVARPSPLAIRPVFLVGLGVILLPVVGVVAVGLLGRFGGGAAAPPAPMGPMAQQAPAPGAAAEGEPPLPPGAIPPWMLRQDQPPVGRGEAAGAPAGEPLPGRIEAGRPPAEAYPFQPVAPAPVARDGEAEQNPFRPVAPSPAAGEAEENPFRPATPAGTAGGSRPPEENPFQPAAPARGAWRPGMKAEASWANRWLPVTILEVQPDGRLKIHWEGYSDAFDEVVPAERLRPAPRPAE